MLDFLMSAAGGGIVGGVLRLIPAVLHIFQAQGDRDHEYRMAQLAMQQHLEDVNAERDKGELVALAQAIKSQGQLVGNSFIDGISSTVRPFVTYWFLFIYSAVKWAILTSHMIDGMPEREAILAIWTPDDLVIFSCIISCWFVDRSLRRQ